jgi:hypothetical protein
MIRTEIRDGIRGEVRTLTENDPEYWTGEYRYEPFPKVLFRATGPQTQDVEERVVRSDRELRDLDGAWKETPDLAREYERGLQADIAKAAAEENYRVTKMSAPAQAEHLAHDRAEFDHVVDVPAPRKKPGRKPKAAVPESV